jgi:hypothetical protein
MKKVIFASVAAIAMSAAASYAQDSESLTYNLNGSIASNSPKAPST